MNPVANQKLGARFERVVQESFDWQCCTFTVAKVTPPARIIGKRVVFLANPFLDFVGVMRVPGLQKGVPLFVECKATTKPKLVVGSGGISEQQVQSLVRWRNAQSIAFVLWCCVGLGVRAFGCVELMEAARNCKTLKWDEIGSIVPVHDGKLDMVSAVRMVEERNQTKGQS